MRVLCSALALCSLLQVPARAVEPAPQYSAEQLASDLSDPASHAADDCAAGGLAASPEAGCAPRTRGFSLARPGRGTSTPGSSTQSSAGARGRSTATYTHGRNLLITFANDSTSLTKQAQANAQVFAQVANSAPFQGVRFEIDGHTNAVGGREYNLKLSRARAEALVDFLAAQGVDRSRFEVNGYGFDHPSDAGHPAAAGNRRVEARRLN
jgi:outer membrane protein OmpA-like peptidoglycan-associated protein